MENSSAIDRNAIRSSIAPVSTVPAQPMTQNGWLPASISCSIACRNRLVSIRCSESVSILRNQFDPIPDMSSACEMHLWAALDAYAVNWTFELNIPCFREFIWSATFLAMTIATKFAIDDPVRNTPVASSGNRNNCFIQSTTSFSTSRGIGPVRRGLRSAHRSAFLTTSPPRCHHLGPIP